MPANAALRDYLLTRRSVGQTFLRDPGPNADELAQILTIATRVPDHTKLTPWRLVLFEGEARVEAGERLAALARSRNPAIEEAALEIERARFLPSPLVVGVVFSHRFSPKAPEIEQLLSAGNVAFNLVHGAAALGFGANWVTRWYTFDIEAQALLGAGPGERFVGFVHIGTTVAAPEDRPRPALETVVSRWQG
jgi:nitroreductase